jgi:hypothetical protein
MWQYILVFLTWQLGAIYPVAVRLVSFMLFAIVLLFCVYFCCLIVFFLQNVVPKKVILLPRLC